MGLAEGDDAEGDLTQVSLVGYGGNEWCLDARLG